MVIIIGDIDYRRICQRRLLRGMRECRCRQRALRLLLLRHAASADAFERYDLRDLRITLNNVY